MEQSKAGQCVFRKIVDRKANVMTCVYIDDLVTATIKGTSEAFHGQLTEGFFNDV